MGAIIGQERWVRNLPRAANARSLPGLVALRLSLSFRRRLIGALSLLQDLDILCKSRPRRQRSSAS